MLCLLQFAVLPLIPSSYESQSLPSLAGHFFTVLEGHLVVLLDPIFSVRHRRFAHFAVACRFFLSKWPSILLVLSLSFFCKCLRTLLFKHGFMLPAWECLARMVLYEFAVAVAKHFFKFF